MNASRNWFDENNEKKIEEKNKSCDKNKIANGLEGKGDKIKEQD